MDTEIYISSGILELYCAGALSEAEMREVERMASQFAAVKTEIQAIELALWSFNDHIFAGPHEQFKNELIAGIKINSLNNIVAEKATENALNKVVELETPSIEMPKELPVGTIIKSASVLFGSLEEFVDDPKVHYIYIRHFYW